MLSHLAASRGPRTRKRGRETKSHQHTNKPPCESRWAPGAALGESHAPLVASRCAEDHRRGLTVRGAELRCQLDTPVCGLSQERAWGKRRCLGRDRLEADGSGLRLPWTPTAQRRPPLPAGLPPLTHPASSLCPPFLSPLLLPSALPQGNQTLLETSFDTHSWGNHLKIRLQSSSGPKPPPLIAPVPRRR